jgi:hypothetical protein
MVSSPYRTPRRCISRASVPRMRAPVAPTGWPSAIPAPGVAGSCHGRGHRGGPHGQDRAGQLTPPASSSWTSACQAWTVRKPPGGSPAPGTAAAHPHPDDLRPGHYIYGALCACAGGFLLKDVAGVRLNSRLSPFSLGCLERCRDVPQRQVGFHVAAGVLPFGQGDVPGASGL